MTKETLDDLGNVIGVLRDFMECKSYNNVTSIPTYDLLRQVNKLKKVFHTNMEYSFNENVCITVEEASSEKFEDCVDNYLQNGYKISASSCNSKTWKAILVKEDEEQEKE